jgi:hypothetical protein
MVLGVGLLTAQAAAARVRIWERWAADIAAAHPGCKVGWQWGDGGFAAVRPGGETLRSYDPGAVRAFLAGCRRTP